MKRIVLLSAALVAAFVCGAKEVSIELDVGAAKRPFFADGVIPVGYAADPKPGDEAAALACRRAGAWIFQTSACDDATLAFLSQYGLRIVLVMDGDLKALVDTLSRIVTGKYTHVLAGVQLGSDPTGGKDLAKWRSVLSAVKRANLKCPVILPVKDFSSPFIDRMKGYLGSVTHLMVDLRDASAPYERLNRLAVAIEQSPDASIKKLRLMALAPGRLPDSSDEKAASPRTLAWQTHWFITAFSVPRIDTVFFDRSYGPDDFGLLLRHLWATTARAQKLVVCGEAAAIVKVETAATRKSASTEDELSLDDSAELNADDMAAALTAGTAPVACAKVAEGRPGDLQYLALVADPEHVEDEGVGGRMCLLMVNTSGERADVRVKLNTKSGGTGSGFRRRFVPDQKAGGMSVLVRERLGVVSEGVESGEVTFVSFLF